MVCANRQVSGSTSTGASIAGGFVLVSVASLMAAWRSCRSAPLGIGDFRAWLASLEMVARRCMVEQGRAPTYGFAELAKLLGVSEKRARSSVGRLVAAGLLTWSDSAIGFPDPRVEQVDLEDTIGGGRGSLAIPRRMLRLLAGGARPALIATVLAILLRCLSRGRGGFKSRGRIKASWIALVFGVDLRRVKQARRELTDLEWIAPEGSDQRALNRWGACYRIRLSWDRAQPVSGPRMPPLGPAERPANATPSFDREPLPEREKNQEPARRGGPDGIKPGGAGEGKLATAGEVTELAKPIRIHPNSGSAGMKPVSALPFPTLDDVRPEDVADVGRTLELHRQAVAKGLADPSEDGRLKFLAVAEHARGFGARNPGGLFIALLRRGAWAFATQADEDAARRRLRDHLRGPSLSPVATLSSRQSARPVLSEDARAVLRLRSALAAAGYRGDPFPQVRRHDPSWTRERWDRASADASRRPTGRLSGGLTDGMKV